MLRALATWTATLSLGAGLACASPGSAPHPATHDPAERDASFPAALLSQPIQSAGSTMNGILYVPAGAGPHPTAILLHGFPGDERNLDLAHALRRSGWTVLFFHYRGAWGSEGTYSISNMLDDVAAAVAFAGTPELAKTGRSDPDRIALVGHSMGGFAALTVGSERDDVDCVVSIAGANVARLAPPDAATARMVSERLDPLTRPLAGATGASIVAELSANAERFDTTRRAEALSAKPVLLLAGAHDEVVAPALHHTPLAKALRSAGATRLTDRILQADHAFSPRRIALATTIADWLGAECR